MGYWIHKTTTSAFVSKARAECEGKEENEIDSHDDLSNLVMGSDVKTQRNRQYWLDLRDVAILPSEALKFLEEHVSDDYGTSDPIRYDPIHQLVDQVIISEDAFYREISRQNVFGSKILYASNDGGDLVGHDPFMLQSIPIGKVITCRESSVVDPLYALEITTDGGWVLIESELPDEGFDWLANRIRALVDFLLSASASSSSPSFTTLGSSLISGLFIPTYNARRSKIGGVAVSCRSKTTLMQINGALEESMTTVMLTSATDSGIVLATGMTDRPLDAILKTALVLPFDAVLWRTLRDIEVAQTGTAEQRETDEGKANL